MAITSEFMEAVNNGNRTRVRIMLKDIMLVDPTMAKFDEMLKYAASKMSNLYDEHDDETLKYDRTEWNEAYLNNQMVVVVGNFLKNGLNCCGIWSDFYTEIRQRRLKHRQIQSRVIRLQENRLEPV